MATKNQVELILKATDLSSKTFADVSAAVTALNAKLAEQTVQASKGQVSAKELAATMRQLGEAGDALAKQQGVADLYRSLGTQLDTAQEKAAKAALALDAGRATLAALESPTKTQTNEVTKLSTAYDRAEAAVLKVQARLDAQAATLAKVGIDTASLAAAEEQLAVVATQTAAGRAAAQAAIDTYDTKLAAHKALVAATAVQEKAAAEALRQYHAEEAAAAAAAASAAPRDLSGTGGSAADVAAFRNKLNLAEALRKLTEQQRINEIEEMHAEAIREDATRTIAKQTAAYDANTKAAEAGWAAMSKRAGTPAGASATATTTTGFLGLKPFELQNLSFQVNDVVTGLASGQHLTQVIAQQAGQIFQIFQSQLGRIAASIRTTLAGIGLGLGPIGAIITAVVAVIALATAAVIRFTNTGDSIRQFTAELKTSADGAQYNATQIVGLQRQMQLLGAGFDAAGTALRTFISAGIEQDKLLSFGKAAQELSHTFGVALPEAAKTVADAFTTNYAAIQKLDGEYNIYTQKQLETIRNLFDEGKATEARAMAQDIFTAKLKTSSDLVDGDFTNAWKSLKGALSAVLDLFDPIISGIGRMAASFTNSLGAAINGVVLGLRELRNLLPGGNDNATDPAVAGLKLSISKSYLAATPKPEDGASPDDFASKRYAAAQQMVADAQAKVNDLTAKQTALAGPAAAGTNSVAAATERQAKAGEAALRAQADQIAKGNVQTPAARLDAVGRAAGDAADALKVSDATRALLVANARADEQRKITEENLGKTEALTQQVNAAAAQAGKSQKDQLAARLKAIDDQFKSFDTKVADLQKRGVSSVDGKPIADYQADLENSKAILKREETKKFNKEQQAEAEKGLSKQQTIQNELASLTAAGDKAQTASLKAQLDAVDQTYSHIYGTIAAAQRAGIGSAGGRSIAEIKAEIDAQKELIQQQVTVKFYETNLGEAVKARDTTTKSITDAIKDGNLSAADGYAQAQEANAKLAPKITQLAEDALKFAIALNSAKPSPQLTAFIATTQRTLAQNTGSGSTSVAAKTTAEVGAAALEPINLALQARNELERAYQNLSDKGIISQAEANAKIKNAYAETSDSIADAIAKAQEFFNGIPADKMTPQVELLKAKFADMSSKIEYSDPAIKRLGTQINQAIGNDAATAIDSMTAALGKAVAGTESLGDAFKDVGIASAQFFADVLKDIAKVIIEKELLALIGGDGKSGSAGGVGGYIATFAALLHGGGVVGRPGGAMRPISQSWFDNAPRYHSGSVVGLGADEQAAILQRGEEVLNKDDPRNVLNAARKGAMAGGQPTNIRSVLVLDNNLIPQAMQSSEGESITLSHIKKNIATIRQMVR